MDLTPFEGTRVVGIVRREWVRPPYKMKRNSRRVQCPKKDSFKNDGFRGSSKYEVLSRSTVARAQQISRPRPKPQYGVQLGWAKIVSTGPWASCTKPSGGFSKLRTLHVPEVP